MIAFFTRVMILFRFPPKEAERFSKFLVVGTIGFIVDFGTLAFLKELFNMVTLVANTISFSAAVVSNFTLNRYWTYPDSRNKRIMAQLVQFTVVSILGLAINNTILLLTEPIFGRLLTDLNLLGGRGYIPSKALATIVVLFWNFFVNRYWTYNDVE